MTRIAHGCDRISRKAETMTDKRYNAFSEELKRVFGCRVHRISVDAGFTCPNRDGTVGADGCIYCGGAGSGSFGIARGLSIAAQLEDGKEVMVRKYKAKKFIAYFQPYSNTYAPVERLAALYDEALAVKDIVGLIVGTRPDCLPPKLSTSLQSMPESAGSGWSWASRPPMTGRCGPLAGATILQPRRKRSNRAGNAASGSASM